MQELSVPEREHYSSILKILEVGVVYMKRNIVIFRKVRELVKFEKDIISGLNHLLTWVVDIYTTDLSMNIRRLVDVNPRPYCRSLYKFLIDLKNCASVEVDEEEIQQDINTLDGERNTTLKRIVNFTLQDRAHSDERSRVSDNQIRSRFTDIRFDEDVFPEAQNIENLFVKYYMLIEGRNPRFMEQEYANDMRFILENVEETFKRIYREKLSNNHIAR